MQFKLKDHVNLNDNLFFIKQKFKVYPAKNACLQFNLFLPSICIYVVTGWALTPSGCIHEPIGTGFSVLREHSLHALSTVTKLSWVAPNAYL